MKTRSSCSNGEEHSNGNSSDCEKIDDKRFLVRSNDSNGFDRDGIGTGCHANWGKITKQIMMVSN